MDVTYTIDKQISAGLGHLRRSSGMAPLQKVAVATDSGSFVGFAGSKAKHDSLDFGGILRLDHSTDNAFYPGFSFLDVPDLHGLAKRFALRQRA